MIRLVTLAAVLALAGCGVVSDAARTGPGGAYMATKHVDGTACPDLVIQGAINVAEMALSCANGVETASFKNLDPVPAMAEANKAMAMALGVLAKLAAGAMTGGAALPLNDPLTDPVLHPEAPLVIQ